jgi:hypothetical protein|tara:strand:- start:169 stop:342 length:174 start_codon:yes stop_codon:yes gene_type:complete
MKQLTMESLLDIQTVYCETEANPALWSHLGKCIAASYLQYIEMEDAFPEGLEPSEEE